MKIKDIALSAAYVGQRVVKAICVGAQEVWSAVKYIVFKDPVVEQICATNFGDGTGLTEEYAAKVTKLGTVFKGNTDITSFDEFEMFTGVEVIAEAFASCANLTSIKLPPSLTQIGYYCFDSCSFSNIDIPQGVTTLGEAAFFRSKLQSVTLPPNTTSLAAHIFSACTQLVSVDIQGNVTAIPANTFSGCAKLIDFHCAGEIQRFEKNCFSGCSQLNIEIPSSVVYIGASSFGGTKIRKAFVPGEQQTLFTTTFASCSELEEIVINEGITKIEREAVAYCGKLHNLELPSTIENLDNYCFLNCPLDELIIKAITPPTLGSRVFIADRNFPIYVPDQSVQAYRETSGWLDYADRIWPMEAYLYGIITFADPAVEAICLANFDTNGSGYLNKEEAKAVTSIGTIFQGNTEIVSFDEFNEFLGITSITYTAFQNCTSLRRIKIPQNVTRLENYVFSGCENLESISLPNSLITIDDGVFTNCKMLENIDIPDSCVNWNGGAQFRYCEKLKSINFPTGMTRIPGYCLGACKSLESVQIPETVTTIGDNAFSSTPIAKIDLGANLTEVGNYICFACTKLKVAIVRATTPPKSGVNIFYLADCVIYVPDESVDAYKAKENWSTYADRIKPLSEYVEQ